jgi:hypothetical protein
VTTTNHAFYDIRGLRYDVENGIDENLFERIYTGD